MLGGAAAAGGLMMPGAAGAGAFVPGAGFLGFDMTNPMAAAGFNPFMFGFPQAGAPLMSGAWFSGAGMGSASSFHAPG